MTPGLSADEIRRLNTRSTACIQYSGKGIVTTLVCHFDSSRYFDPRLPADGFLDAARERIESVPFTNTSADGRASDFRRRRTILGAK